MNAAVSKTVYPVTPGTRVRIPPPPPDGIRARFPWGAGFFAVERRDSNPQGAERSQRREPLAAQRPARRSRADIPPPPSSSTFHSCALSVHFRALVLSGMGNGAHALEANLQVFAWCQIGFRKPQDWCQTKPRVVSERRVMLWLHGRGQERHRPYA